MSLLSSAGTALKAVPLFRWAQLAGILIFLGTILAGCLWLRNTLIQQGRDQQLAVDKPVIEAKKAALREASRQLGYAAEALNQQNEANKLKIAAAEAARKDAEEKEQTAKDALAAANKSIADFSRRLENAKKNPDCKAILETDVIARCKL